MKKAEQVARSIVKAFPAYDDVEPPKVVEDADGQGTTVVFWEEGPYEWAHLYMEMISGYAAVDEEFGFKHKPVAPVKGVWVEPYYSFAVGVYKD